MNANMTSRVYKGSITSCYPGGLIGRTTNIQSKLLAHSHDATDGSLCPASHVILRNVAKILGRVGTPVFISCTNGRNYVLVISYVASSMDVMAPRLSHIQMIVPVQARLSHFAPPLKVNDLITYSRVYKDIRISSLPSLFLSSYIRFSRYFSLVFSYESFHPSYLILFNESFHHSVRLYLDVSYHQNEGRLREAIERAVSLRFFEMLTACAAVSGLNNRRKHIRENKSVSMVGIVDCITRANAGKLSILSYDSYGFPPCQELMLLSSYRSCNATMKHVRSFIDQRHANVNSKSDDNLSSSDIRMPIDCSTTGCVGSGGLHAGVLASRKISNIAGTTTRKRYPFSREKSDLQKRKCNPVNIVIATTGSQIFSREEYRNFREESTMAWDKRAA